MLGLFHQRRELWRLGPELIGDGMALPAGLPGITMCKCWLDEGRVDKPPAASAMRRHIAHDADGTTKVDRTRHFCQMAVRTSEQPPGKPCPSGAATASCVALRPPCLNQKHRPD